MSDPALVSKCGGGMLWVQVPCPARAAWPYGPAAARPGRKGHSEPQSHSCDLREIRDRVRQLGGLVSWS